ncbi:hypothetical protein [Rariglobus hedericola]|uniref:Asl1-like glycosyl hydrolase catalytic domain-containing protein n=1 Tax=Rariglobus hedericola TaxID=2597822 RepID=A0A556QQM5_9BACT|nr:hypothetical protein [Rariglobus hedericola]TSJ78947.1 hypothetical protein FPL22_06495 [Rariglobus hedericola]
MLVPIVRAAGYGFDVLTPPAAYAVDLEAAGLSGQAGTWMRVRGLIEPTAATAVGGRTVETDRAGLAKLRRQGIKTAVLVLWHPPVGSKGVRSGPGRRLPLDLREAYERGRILGAAYGDLVDVWEIENEPDIGFVADNPETYTAFHKALYLGLKNGASASAVSLSHKVKFKWQSVQSTWRTQKRGWSDLQLNLSSSTHERREPLVIMAPLALPPGPYLERLWANGIASYTDGFNFHYYGYSDDFTGVYRQFENAISILNAETAERAERYTSSSSVNSVTSVLKKKFPVFITEYGYGLLDGEARNTVEGRVRQWRWFASVAKQVRILRPEGPMAFVLNPYYEAGLNEFGLGMAAQPELRGSLSHKIKVKEKQGDGGQKTEDGEWTEPRGEDGHVQSTRPRSGSDGVNETGHLLGGRVNNTEDRGQTTEDGGQDSAVSANSVLKFSPDDFGAKHAQPWMAGIGKKVGDAYASPALAYLWDYAERNPYRSRDWTVKVAPSSPVVIDFIADADLTQLKASGGYRLQGLSAEWTPLPLRKGRGRWVLYNFGAVPITGALEIAAPTPVTSTYDPVMTLAPGERREIPVELTIDGSVWTAHAFTVRFVPRIKTVSPAVFTTVLYPAAYGMVTETIESFTFMDNREARAQVGARPLASEEPQLYDQGGRWLATDGVRVEEKDGLWRIHIDYLADTSLRPAAVELPLPRGFVFPQDTLFSFRYRIGKVGGTDDGRSGVLSRGTEDRGQMTDGTVTSESGNLKVTADGRRTMNGVSNKPVRIDPMRFKPLSGVHGDAMGVYFRTANGNLYFAGGRLPLTAEWGTYTRPSQDFTMGFFGRAALPWRFSDNTPVSLFIYLRPSQLPAVFEIRDARIVRFREE